MEYWGNQPTAWLQVARDHLRRIDAGPLRDLRRVGGQDSRSRDIVNDDITESGNQAVGQVNLSPTLGAVPNHPLTRLLQGVRRVPTEGWGPLLEAYFYRHYPAIGLAASM